ncbi:hypothetical protein FRC16_011235 [Serendipita sp. 398]|nr:hypothetical protein FRC16_011235 [Serendipita sp. 398]
MIGSLCSHPVFSESCIAGGSSEYSTGGNISAPSCGHQCILTLLRSGEVNGLVWGFLTPAFQPHRECCEKLRYHIQCISVDPGVPEIRISAMMEFRRKSSPYQL